MRRLNYAMSRIVRIGHRTAIARFVLAGLCVALAGACRLRADDSGDSRPTPWPRHTIDDQSRGADGVRLADLNRDGRLDIVTGWEEGGVVRVYLQPGPQQVKSRWPSVTVGRVASPEDAVFADVDRDGRLDVVSSCEGSNRTMYVHWCPSSMERLGEDSAWQTSAIPSTVGKQSWMFATPLEAFNSGMALVTGSKGRNAAVGLLSCPRPSRRPESWSYRRLCEAGWIMSLRVSDMDQDGDPDIVFSDRKGRRRGVWWLENPGAAGAASAWQRHRIGGQDCEVMFLDLHDLNDDDRTDVVVATRNGKILLLENPRDSGDWSRREIANPFGVPHGKAVAVGDIDGDGDLDLVHTANTQGRRDVPGVAWLENRGGRIVDSWRTHDISGPTGVKFDRIELLDLDGDGDLDVLTCEERDNLGVFWYENPGAR